MLDEVPKVIAMRGYTKGLAAAGDVMEAALWPRTPVNALAALDRKSTRLNSSH